MTVNRCALLTSSPFDALAVGGAAGGSSGGRTSSAASMTCVDLGA